jgi:two-component system sensor histidine kinase QseC
MYSIRRFLGLGLMLVVGGGMLLMSAATYHIVSHEVEERFDAQLSQSARLLRAMITAPIEAGQDPQDALSLHLQTQDYLGLEAGIHGHHYETKISFQVLDESGKVLFRSIGAPEKAFDERELGFSYHWHDDQKWRIFRIHDERVGLWLLVGERADVRGEIVRELATLALLGNAFGLPFIVVLIWSVLHVGLRPLIRIAESIAGRAPDRLTPINSRGLPRELAGIVEELNRLLNRLGLAMEREKRFTADAAHELRTPLAVLRVHAQNAASSSDPELRQRSLSQLTRAVDRATHLVEQLLALARLEPGDVPAERHPVDFLRVARDEVAQLAPKALNKQQELWLECDESNLRVLASEVPLSMLLRNLIDNAIRYGREGGEVRVSLQRDGDTVQLHVCDDGPGVPAALRERIFERFYQAAPGKGQGAGLGLSIVRRIAELYGAQMHADEAPGGGLCVIVSFPLVD